MPYNLELYSELEARLKDWINAVGGEVTDLPLDLLNRAQNDLTMERRWSDMMFTSALTAVSGESKAYSFPSDMACFRLISTDSNSDGKPDEYYFAEGRQYNGYYLEDRFDKATGHAWVAIFYVDPATTPKVNYQKRLSDFTGSGTEYTFFPGELLLLTAQKIHIIETGLTDASYRAILDAQGKALDKYIAAHQYVNTDLVMEIKDASGRIISTESSDLSGNFSENNNSLGFNNDVDLR